MAALIVNRTNFNALVDDDGSNTTGSIWNKAAIASVLLDQIDALYSVFGDHFYEAGGAGNQNLSVRNTSAGAANTARLQVGNDAALVMGGLIGHSSTFTSSGFQRASGALLYCDSSGGLTIAASHASGTIDFYAGDAVTRRGRITAAGLFAWEQFGIHTFAAGGTGGNRFQVKNTTAGTGNFATIEVLNDTSLLLQFAALSSTWTNAAQYFQSGGAISFDGSGGLSIASTHASATVRVYAGGTTMRAQFPIDGGFAIQDGITAPATVSGFGVIYIDSADGDLKIKFADGFVRTIGADS